MKKYVITSAQKGAKINKKFFDTLNYYCEKENAKLFIIPLEHSMGNLAQFKKAELDKDLVEFIVKKDTFLCRKLEICTLPISPTAMNPLRSLHRLGNFSRIYGSTKLAMDVVPTSNCKLPKIIISTGVCTEPQYNLASKQGRIASLEHKYSAVVVEVVSNDEYHLRQLEANENMEINDLGYKYSCLCTKKFVGCEAIVLGDWHTGETDQIVKKIALDQIFKLLKPKTVFLEDFFSGVSVNHHHEHDIITKALKAMSFSSNLQLELDNLVLEANDLLNKSECNWVVVASNHHDFLTDYIKTGTFMKYPENIHICAKLLVKMLDSRNSNSDPLKLYMEAAVKSKRMKWLSVDEDYKIRGIQFANHGHLGANGAKGSLKSEEVGSIKANVAHTHSPAIERGVWRTGTSTVLKLDYNHGHSSWVNSHLIQYYDGTRQIINIINGKWKS